jgi:AraC-like DNA-binding protein
MDPLSDLLRIVRLDGAYFYEVEASEPWSVETLPARELAPRVLPGTDHLIAYHLLTEGRCYAGLAGEEQVELVPGDVIVFPHGDAHVMSSERGVRVPEDKLREAPTRYPFTVVLGDQGPPVTSFVCGFLGCDRRPFNPLLESLPRQMHMAGVSNPWLSAFTRELAGEVRLGRAGVESVVTRLAEVLFIQLLRRYLDSLPPEQTGWLAGIRDPVVGRALTLLHSQTDHAWTVGELARKTSSSRSSFSKHFAELVGAPPMHYLAQWRMQVAASLLMKTTLKVSAIGLRVGYDSEAAFSRAFKRATGLAPGAWRQGQTAEH